MISRSLPAMLSGLLLIPALASLTTSCKARGRGAGKAAASSTSYSADELEGFQCENPSDEDELLRPDPGTSQPARLADPGYPYEYGGDRRCPAGCRMGHRRGLLSQREITLRRRIWLPRQSCRPTKMRQCRSCCLQTSRPVRARKIRRGGVGVPFPPDTAMQNLSDGDDQRSRLHGNLQDKPAQASRNQIVRVDRSVGRTPGVLPSRNGTQSSRALRASQHVIKSRKRGWGMTRTAEKPA